MKYTTILSVIILFFSYGIKAQESTDKLRIGLNAGFEKNLSSDYLASDKFNGYFADYNKTNYRIGVNFEYEIKSNFSINTAINYSNKDFTGTFDCATCDFIVDPLPEKINFRFIEVPLTLKYYFLPNKIRLFGELGLNNLFSLNEEVTDNSYLSGIKFGGGIEYNLSKKTALQITIDYNKAISKVNKDSNFKLQSLAFGIGIMKRL